MTPFYIVAGLLTVLTVAWVLQPLLRRRDPDTQPQRSATNLAILRDQLAELEADLTAGTLSDEQYEQAKRELERRVLEEAGKATAEPAVAGAKRRTPHLTALALALLLPVGAALVYLQIGNPGAMVQPEPAPHAFTPEQIEQLVAQLAERMRNEPDDPRGWAILGRTYYVMGRYGDAAAAYEQLLKRIPPDADVLAEYADSLAMAQGRKLAGKPLEALEQAIALDGNHWKTLALLGTEAFEREDYQGALRYWQKLLALTPPEAEITQQIAASVAEARVLAGLDDSPPGGERAAVGAAGEPVAQAAASGEVDAPAVIGGTVRLAPALAAQVAPDDTVFVYARPVSGSNMPLAVLRFQVKDLPATFQLDDSLAMTPAARLSQHERVSLGARISKSGNATAQSGDLTATAQVIDVGRRDVALLIDTPIQ